MVHVFVPSSLAAVVFTLLAVAHAWRAGQTNTRFNKILTKALLLLILPNLIGTDGWRGRLVELTDVLTGWLMVITPAMLLCVWGCSMEGSLTNRVRKLACGLARTWLVIITAMTALLMVVVALGPLAALIRPITQLVVMYSVLVAQVFFAFYSLWLAHTTPVHSNVALKAKRHQAIFLGLLFLLLFGIALAELLHSQTAVEVLVVLFFAMPLCPSDSITEFDRALILVDSAV